MSSTEPVHFYDEFPEISLGELFGLLEQTARNLRQIQRETVSEAGLTPAQYSVLHLLWERDERPFRDFAEALLCTPATVTGIIDTLERKGLVRRKPNPADRRSLLATLTEGGRALQGSTPNLDRVYDSCCSGVTPLEARQLAFLLGKLNDSLSQKE